MNSMMEVYVVQRFGQEPRRNREQLRLFQTVSSRQMFRQTMNRLGSQLIRLGEQLQESQNTVELQGDLR